MVPFGQRDVLWVEAVDLAGCNLARELRWYRSGLFLGALGGLVFFFVRGTVWVTESCTW